MSNYISNHILILMITNVSICNSALYNRSYSAMLMKNKGEGQ